MPKADSTKHALRFSTVVAIQFRAMPFHSNPPLGRARQPCRKFDRRCPPPPMWFVASHPAVDNARDADLLVVPCPCLCSRMIKDGEVHHLVKLAAISKTALAFVWINVQVPFIQQESVETRRRRARRGRV